MKKISKFILIVLSLFILTGCGSFFGTEEQTGIANIEKKELEDGSIQLIITYYDEEIDPVIMTFPKGKDGLKGNGINNIEAVPGDENTKLVITYTDTSKLPVEFDIPHGAEIKEIIVVDDKGNIIEDEEYIGAKFIKVIYTEVDPKNPDQNKSSLFELPKGEKGNGIETIYAGKLNPDGTIDESKRNEDGSVTLGIKYTDSDELQILNIPSSKSIIKVEANDTGNVYKLKIIYNMVDPITGKDYEEFSFIKPKITQWLYGESSPNDGMGNIGDYYFDKTFNIIYFKIELDGYPAGHWDEIVNLGSSNQRCEIKFILNLEGAYFEELDSNENVIRNYNDKITSLKKGTYFYKNNEGKQIPTPRHNEYTFVGWYTDVPLQIFTSKFTDLTIVNTDITLYALWQKNN